jgi:outer membrane murein-binding lipoprotein Lpp
MELEATGPSRIFNAAQTAAMLSGPGADDAQPGSTNTARLEALVLQLTQEVEGLRAEARATATHTARSARLLDRMERDGLTVKTDADTPLSTVAI